VDRGGCNSSIRERSSRSLGRVTIVTRSRAAAVQAVPMDSSRDFNTPYSGKLFPSSLLSSCSKNTSILTHSPYYVCAESATGSHGIADSFTPRTIGHSEKGFVTGLLLRSAAGSEKYTVGPIENRFAKGQSLH